MTTAPLPTERELEALKVLWELGEAPVPFENYAYPLLQFALGGGFRYPYVDWPADADKRLAAVA